MLPVLLFSMVAHEYAHGYAALRQGDHTAERLGRLTFNPRAHIDPWLTVLMPAMLWFGSGGRFLFGGAKPVPVNPSNYRDPVRGDIIVSSAGIVANLILWVACGLLVAAVGIVGQTAPGLSPILTWVQRAFIWGIWLNLLLANFNLIPIPPLDGSHLLIHALPPAARAGFRQLSRYGFLILLGILFFMPGLLTTLLTPAILALQLSLQILAPFTLQPFGLF